MIHPLEHWPRTRRRAALVGLLVLFVACTAVFSLNDGPLRTDAAPQGIIDLELAGNAATADEIRSSWVQAEALDEAGFSIGFDFVFLVVYSTGLAALCAVGAGAVRRRGARSLAGVGVVLGWAAWLAAVCDAAENAAMMPLLDRPTDAWAATAQGFAMVKFALLGFGLAFVVAAGIVAAIRRPDAVA